jgi:hypothetical protein
MLITSRLLLEVHDQLALVITEGTVLGQDQLWGTGMFESIPMTPIRTEVLMEIIRRIGKTLKNRNLRLGMKTRLKWWGFDNVRIRFFRVTNNLPLNFLGKILFVLLMDLVRTTMSPKSKMDGEILRNKHVEVVDH